MGRRFKQGPVIQRAQISLEPHQLERCLGLSHDWAQVRCCTLRSRRRSSTDANSSMANIGDS